MADADSKVCRTCGVSHPFSNFYAHRSGKDGLQGICKACHLKDCHERYHRTKVLRPLSQFQACAHCGKEFPRPQPARPGDPPRSSTKHCSVDCRFWSKVDKSGGPDACWPWIAKARCQSGTGYGNFGLAAGKYVHSHRMAWTLTNGQIPDGLNGCHKCDNPLCCNPSHLFLGTHKENMVDMERKGRGWNMTKDPDLIERLRAMKIGKARSPEVRAKLSAALVGRKVPVQVVDKIAAKNKGKKRSEETIARMRDAQRRRRANEALSLSK